MLDIKDLHEFFRSEYAPVLEKPEHRLLIQNFIDFYNNRENREWNEALGEVIREPFSRPTQRALDGACESCKLELTPNCPIRTGNGCDLFQPRQ